MIKTISDLFGRLRAGRTQDDLMKAVSDAVAAVNATGKAAKVTLTMTISPAAKDSSMVKFDDMVEAKLPKADRAPTILFTDGQNKLHEADPAQAVRETTDISAPNAREIRETSGAAPSLAAVN